MKFAILFCLLFFLACEKSNVEVVKNAKLKDYNHITLKKAIDKSKICQKVDYIDNSKEGLILVSVICEENQDRVNSRYDDKMKAIKANLTSIKADYDQNMSKEIAKFKQFAKDNFGNENLLSDYEIKEAARKYCVKNKDLITLFTTPYICDNKEFSNYLAQKDDSDDDEAYYYGAANYIQGVAILLGRNLLSEAMPNDMAEAPRKVKKLAYQMDFLVNADKDLVIQNTYIILDDEKYEASNIIEQFFKK